MAAYNAISFARKRARSCIRVIDAEESVLHIEEQLELIKAAESSLVAVAGVAGDDTYVLLQVLAATSGVGVIKELAAMMHSGTVVI